MKKTSLLMLLAVGIMVIQCGCGAQRAQRTGFLSDYSKLKPYSDVSYRNIPSQATIRRYSKFIIDPIVVHFHTGSKAIEERTKGKIAEQDITDLKNYMHDAIVKAISDRYRIAYRPGPGGRRASSVDTTRGGHLARESWDAHARRRLAQLPWTPTQWQINGDGNSHRLGRGAANRVAEGVGG